MIAYMNNDKQRLLMSDLLSSYTTAKVTLIDYSYVNVAYIYWHVLHGDLYIIDDIYSPLVPFYFVYEMM